MKNIYIHLQKRVHFFHHPLRERFSETQRFALVTHDIHIPCDSTKEKPHVTGNATISATHTVITEEFDEVVLENEEIIANVKMFLRDGCGCSRGVKGGPRC